MRRTLLVAMACAALAHAACAPQPPAPPAGSTQTRFPIVLAEGLFGFNFINIAEDLRAGGAMVFTTEVDPFNDNVTRAQQLTSQIRAILAQTGATRVNLFAHSQGGLDGRVILAQNPELLASLTQVASPNTGSPVADSLLPMDDGALQFVIDFISIAGGEPGNAADLRVALTQLSAAGMTQFNAQFPAGLPSTPCGTNGSRMVNGVPLFSFGGNQVSTNGGDIGDPVLLLTSINFTEPNDGLVAVCATHFGQVIQDNLRANHLDFVNQIGGAVGADPPFMLYRAQAARLRDMGL